MQIVYNDGTLHSKFSALGWTEKNASKTAATTCKTVTAIPTFMKYTLLILFLSTISLNCLAQNNEVTVVESIDGIVNELLDQITIGKGEKIDTAAVRSLFYPSAQFTVLNNGDSSFTETLSLDEFLTLLTDPYYEQGYLEKEIHKVIDEFNGIAQVFQSFYGKDSEGDEDRGMNSYQLAYYNNRWWIVSLLWTLESNGIELPEKYGGN